MTYRQIIHNYVGCLVSKLEAIKNAGQSLSRYCCINNCIQHLMFEGSELWVSKSLLLYFYNFCMFQNEKTKDKASNYYLQADFHNYHIARFGSLVPSKTEGQISQNHERSFSLHVNSLK